MKTRHVFVFLSIMFTNSTLAEEVNKLQEITVMARPITSQSLEMITQPYSILRDEDLKNKRMNTLGETLALEPGVTASDFGRGASNPVIRGLGGPRLNVLRSGIGTLDVSSVSADHNISINPFHVEQVEIIRGPASVLYGSGNTAGVINIVDNRIADTVPEFNTSLESMYQTPGNGRSVAMQAAGGQTNIALYFDFLKNISDDYESVDGTVLNSAVDTTDINLGTSFIGENGYLGVAFNRYESIYQIPLNPSEPDELPFIDMQQNRIDFSGKLASPIPLFNQLQLRAAYNDYQHTEFEGEGMPGTLFTNNDWEARLEASHHLFNQWDGIVGLQYRNRSFSATGDEAFVPSTQQQSLGIFFFHGSDWNNFHFEIGGRYEYQQLEPESISGFSNTTHQVYSLAGGINWFFAHDHVVSMNTSRSQRAPVLEELFANGPHLASETFETGSPGLDAETANSIDFSLARTDPDWNWKINVFANFIEDFIYQEFRDTNNDGVADQVDENGTLGAGDLFSVLVTADNALFYGIEFETLLNLYSGPAGNIDFRIFGDWVKGKLVDGDYLPRISPARLGGEFKFEKDRWRTDLDIIRVFSQDKVADLESTTDSYLLVNFSTRYKKNIGSGDAEVYFQLNNLLDQEATRHTSFIKERAPLPGRIINLGIGLSF